MRRILIALIVIGAASVAFAQSYPGQLEISRILGRITSQGPVQQLTGTQVKTLMGLATTSTDNAIVRFDSTGGNTQDGNGSFVDDSGRLLRGAATAIAGYTSAAITPALQQIGGSADLSAVGFSRWVSSAFGPNVYFGKSRSATPGTYTIVQTGDSLGILAWQGADGTDFEIAATIEARVDGAPASAGDTTDMPGQLVFGTTPDGTNVQVDRWIMDAAGLLKPAADASYDIGTSALGVRDLFITSDVEFNASTDTTLTAPSAGELTLEGDAVKHAGKQVMWIPAAGMKASATSGASCGDTYDSGASDITIVVCAFDTGATEERAEFTIGMPKAWNESTITFIPVSTCAGACAEAETLQYELACAAISAQDSFNATLGTPQSSAQTLHATPTNESIVGVESNAITVGGTPAENDVMHCRISRDTSADNMAGDALLVGIKLFWTDNASTLAE
jgi:hypothetical protein